jgi:menaquinone-9 beta-reductase
MKTDRSFEIAGGGLTGLSLGLSLVRAGMNVEVYEAGTYPRHRVCGEFISGLDAWTRQRLDLNPFLFDALHHSEVAWFRSGKEIKRNYLPQPALAISRHELDKRLAEAFVAAGGILHTGKRLELNSSSPGRVLACGRKAASDANWLGLKYHVAGYALAAPLEVHLGDHSYVGLCALPGGEVNVSGLFRRRADLKLDRGTALMTYLRATGLSTLADKLEAATGDPASHSAVAALGFGFNTDKSAETQLRLGDAFALIPPFTGNGMSMAFQSAALALDPLLEWGKNTSTDWPSTVVKVNDLLKRQFRLRLNTACMLHPFLLQPTSQLGLCILARCGMLPFNSLYRALH